MQRSSNPLFQHTLTDIKIQKLYYSIGQVSKEVGVDAHVLRYWETEFKELNPKKNRSGKRLYKVEDVDLAKRIKELLHVERYTIEGARMKLKSDKSQGTDDKRSDSNELGEILIKVRRGLEELKALLDS